MSTKRSLRDYIHDAFFAGDKASLAAIVKDAETNGLKAKDGKDDDEGGDDGHHVHIHVEGKGEDAKKAPTDDSITGRMTRLEDAVKSFDSKLAKIFDALPKAKDAKAKDGENPFAKKDDDKKDDDDKEKSEDGIVKLGAKDEDGDDKDDDKKKSGDKKTGDESGMGGELTPPESETKTAMTAEQLTEVEPDLMDADPSLKTGKNLMGDAEYIKRTNKALAKVVKDVRARAEILAPGIKFGTIDAKPGQPTADALCKMRRTALNKASPKALGRFTANDMKSMSCAAVRTLFLDASDRQKQINNTASSAYRVGDEAAFERDDQMGQLKQINRANHDFWKNQLGTPRA